MEMEKDQNNGILLSDIVELGSQSVHLIYIMNYLLLYVCMIKLSKVRFLTLPDFVVSRSSRYL